MNKNIFIASLVLAIVVGGASFYGGMTYAENKGPAGFRDGNFNGQLMGGNNRASGGVGMRGGAGFTAGDIITKDDSSITIKMQDGSTKIVLVASSTEISKSVDGTLDDLATGTNVMIMGTTNSDGSVSAQSVQIRPAGEIPIGSPVERR